MTAVVLGAEKLRDAEDLHMLIMTEHCADGNLKERLLDHVVHEQNGQKQVVSKMGGAKFLLW